MGHGSCGGVSASLSHAFVDKAPGDGAFIANWVNLLDEARDRIVAQYGYGEEATRALELETVRVSIANIRTSPFVAEREAAGKLTRRGAYFSIRGGLPWVIAALVRGAWRERGGQWGEDRGAA